MCLAIPLRLCEIHGQDAIAEASGIRRRIRVDFIKNPAVGDYVIVHAGFAIERMGEAQALANLQAIEEAAHAV